MPVRQIIEGQHTRARVFTDAIDELACNQLTQLASLPFVHHHVAAMPDVHPGMGTTVGAVIPTRAAIIPAAVGVDIGCGMNAVRLSLTAEQLPDSLAAVRTAIEAAVPVGPAGHSEKNWCVEGLNRVAEGLRPILQKYPGIHADWRSQMGSLGGGNHFIEICLDEADAVWIMLHSGSRGIGNRIGGHFISLAKEEMDRLGVELPERNLAYLQEGSESFDDYVEAVGWAQDYAMENRRQMMRLVLTALCTELPDFAITEEAIDCHHNYVAREHHYGENVWLTRKGAIRARQGDLGIIPGSMGAKSFIVRGKGNAESLASCAHGAGRLMSRTEAKKRFKPEALRAQTEGIECRKDRNVIDEIPGAYKDIDTVMANQSDLVDIVHTLKQVVCVKG